MKKLWILLLILLSAQLYGCSNHASEANETVSSAPEVYSSERETLLIEENDTKESETMDASVQDMTPLSEEIVTTADDNYYSAATDIPRSDVESYAARVRQLFLEHNWSAISSEISYPITISDITYNNSADFLDASNSFDNNLDEAFFSALEEEDCTEMFCSWEGIMLGETGQIWISEVLDAEFNSQGLKVIAVNGLLKR